MAEMSNMKECEVGVFGSYNILDYDIEKVEKSINKIIEVINSDELFTGENLDIHSYSSILLFLTEIRDVINKDIIIEELIQKCVAKLKVSLEESTAGIPQGAFGGLTDIGYAIYGINTTLSGYSKFLNSLNKYIMQINLQLIEYIRYNIGNLHASSYDAIMGLSGNLAYLLLFKDNSEIVENINAIIDVLVLMTKDIEVYGKAVPGWYTTRDNHFLEEERKYYINGSFNYGLSHGVSGILAVLSMALIEGFERDGQREAVEKILSELTKKTSVDEKGYIYWPGRVSFEDYIKGECSGSRERESWCYGTPGIARAIFLGGKAINDCDSMRLAIDAFEKICSMDEKDFMLISPIICHGYSGVLASIHAMYSDTGNAMFDIGRKKMFHLTLKCFDDNFKYGFCDFEINKNTGDGEYKIMCKDDVGLIEGATGVVLSLLLLIKPSKTKWLKHLLLN